MVPGSFGCGSAVFAAMTMLAPSRAARRPMALPMPRLAPVMKSVLPRSDAIGSLLLTVRSRGRRCAGRTFAAVFAVRLEVVHPLLEALRVGKAAGGAERRQLRLEGPG